MANTKVITAQYIDFIADRVIDKFGGSYQNHETTGRVWRQKMDYLPQIEEALIFDTKLFLRTLDVRDQGDLNMMYNVCRNIADWLSKYLVKKSPDLTRERVTDNVLSEIFLKSPHFVNRFNKIYKRPLNLEDAHWVECNKGVVAMYISVQQEKAKSKLQFVQNRHRNIEAR